MRSMRSMACARAGAIAAAAAMLLAFPASRMAAQENVYTMRSVDKDRVTSITVRGELELTADETAIARLSPGGRFQIERAFPGEPDRMLIVTAPRSGTGALEYVYVVDGRARTWDDDGRRWLATMLPELAMEWGMGAEARVRRIHAERGATGVLDTIDRIRSSRSRRLHLEALLAMGPLSTPEAVRALRVAGGVSSSAERSRLLRSMLAHVDLREAAVRSEFFRAVEGISSSAEKRRVLTEVLDAADLSEAAAHDAIVTSRGISSSAERAAVLVTAAERRPLSSDRLRTAYFDAVNGISSSSERRRVLVALLRRQGNEPEVVRGVVRSAREISSDSEKTAVLMEVPVSQLRDSATARTYRDSIDTIRSSSGRERVTRRLLEAQG